MFNGSRNKGFTLFELLISIILLGIIMIGLQQVLGTALSAYDTTKKKQDLLVTARYAIERMVMFVGESDLIENPVSETGEEIIKVSERLLDTYDNAAYTYDIDGDGIPDADNDLNDLINDDEINDPPDFITFYLNKTDSGNWKLMEMMPDYSTGDLGDYTAPKVICEHVTVFQCKLLGQNLVEILLTVNNDKTEVTLKTRIKARYVVS